MMEHLSKKDIFHWLEEKEKIDTKIVNKIWKNLWGSVWEIWQVLVHYKNTWEHKPKLDDLLQVKYSLIAEWYVLAPEKIKDNFITVITQLVKKWKYVLTLEDNFWYIIKELVDKDLWFYNAKYRTITANSKSLEKAFGRLLKELKK